MNDNSLFSEDKSPLADRLRPVDFSGFIGQEHILSRGKLLRRAIEADRIPSMILWGPPGSGKTTLAWIIAKSTNSNFVTISAVSSGIADAKVIIKKANDDLLSFGKRTILFVDEIHRFNKSQQDIFLPYIEDGTIVFIGATTENPSFEVNSPLLSRTRVFHLRELSKENIKSLLKEAIKKINNGEVRLDKIKAKIEITDEAVDHISELCEGDARDAYNALELAILTTPAKNGIIKIDDKIADDAIQEKFIRYDKGADGHYDAISALHKSLRASDIDASLHYTARMLEAGEDPLYIIRRLVRFASEDIGLADPMALVIAVSAERAMSFIGMPEGALAIAETVIYLAKAPKSRAVDNAYHAAKSDVQNKRLDPIPLDIRNAPTKMMKEFGFGKGYEMYSEKSHLPKNLKDQKYWQDQ